MHRAFTISPIFSFDMNIYVFKTRNVCMFTNKEILIKVIFVGWLKILTWLKFNSEPPELFLGVFLNLLSRRIWCSFWLGFYTRIPFLWWWFTGSLSIFDFFNRHHFFFHISFVPPSFGFDDADFMAFTGLLRSLPFNLHLFPVCLFHEVQFGIEYLLF